VYWRSRWREFREPDMPIYEYQCRTCEEVFEVLVRTGDVATCPSCHGQDLERLLSSFAVNSEERSNATLQAARKRLTRSDSVREKARHEQKEIREHVREDYGIKVPEPKD
jgi:putative FmdB family regulatory protein